MNEIIKKELKDRLNYLLLEVVKNQDDLNVNVISLECNDCGDLIEIIISVKDYEFDPDHPDVDDIPVCSRCLDKRNYDLGGEGEI